MTPLALSRHYPFHYAPFPSDMGDMAKWHFTFELGVPFTPVQQLMAVMPPRRYAAVPMLLTSCADALLAARRAAATTRCRPCAGPSWSRRP
jgi:hypothetical protein